MRREHIPHVVFPPHRGAVRERQSKDDFNLPQLRYNRLVAPHISSRAYTRLLVAAR